MKTKERIILMGGGDHAKVVAEAAKLSDEYIIAGYVDIENIGLLFEDIPYLGSDNDLSRFIKDGLCNAICTVGSVGDVAKRVRVINIMKQVGLEIVNVIHPSAVISDTAVIGKGVFIGAGVIVNPYAKIGNNAIINTGSIIEHDCLISDNVIISPGVILGGRVLIGVNTFIGLGSHIIQCVKIGENVIIGAGSVVIRDIEKNARVAGVPTRRIKNDSSD